MIPADRPSIEMIERERIRRFLAKSWSGKLDSARFRWQRLWAGVPSLVRLPFGARWLIWRDGVSPAVAGGEFESAEAKFVARYLKPGMTVLDIGAHHGFYSLLASHQVGSRGRVLAFEPSSRERRKLRLNIGLNAARNIKVKPVALGAKNGQAEFFQVRGVQTGCNSLRPPAVDEPVRVLHVPVARLDKVLEREGVEQVDFVKMDVEGGELAVLKGAGRLLEQRPRPVMLIEVYDIRTAPWGYAAREIVDYILQRGFRWFSLGERGQLEPVAAEAATFDNNFVAVPEERVEQLQGLIACKERAQCL